MARIRTIKPEFWTSEQVVECSPNARLLFIGMLNFCDDSGVHPANVRRLQMEVFPCGSFSKDQVQAMVSELIANNLVEEYEVDGKPYWLAAGFAKHQKIDQPTFKHPLKDGNIPSNVRRNNRKDSPNNSPNDPRGSGEDSPSVHPRKGKEGKGKEYKPPVSPRGEHATPDQIQRIFDQPQPIDQRFSMTLDWQPNEKNLAARLMSMGINVKAQPALLVSDAIAAFRNHFETNRGLNTQSAWEAKLANWIQRDMRKFESMPQARAMGSDLGMPRLADFPEDD